MVETIMAIYTSVMENLPMIMQIIGAVVVFASTVVKLTPSTKDDEFLGKVVTILEKLSIFNKNA